VSIDSALDCISASGRNRASSRGVLKIKGENSEYQYLNVGLVIGGSVTAFSCTFAGAARPARPPQRLSHSPLAETLFYLVVVTAKASLHFRMRFRPMEYPSSGAQERVPTDQPVSLQPYRN
jgi:hypothetical protein